MTQFKIVNKNTNEVIATDQGSTLDMVKKYDLAGQSQQHLKLIQTS